MSRRAHAGDAAGSNRNRYTAPAILDFAFESLHDQGILRLRIDGESMRPLLHDGDLVDVKPLAQGAQGLRPGALVLVRIRDTLITHRLIEFSERSVIVKGDNRGEPDEMVEASALLGTVAGLRTRGIDIDPWRRPWPWISAALARLGGWELRLGGAGRPATGNGGWQTNRRRRWAALPPRALARLLTHLAIAWERVRGLIGKG